jgi:hypothetical protein
LANKKKSIPGNINPSLKHEKKCHCCKTLQNQNQRRTVNKYMYV